MKWFKEDLYGATITQWLAIDEVIYKGKSKYQNILLFENKSLGRVLVLDGIVQTTEKDEFIYHEMIVHVPIMAHPKPRKVLVIGGGDGGAIEEIFKYNFIERVVMVDIDGKVIDLAKKYLRKICGKAFEDPRLELVVDDGVKYVANTKERFDVIIVDSPDPIGPGKVLFTKKFYEGLYNVLNKVGVVSRQTGSTFFQGNELPQAVKILRQVFPLNNVYLTSVPTYIGGFFSFVLSGKGIKRWPSKKVIEKRFSEAGIKTDFYTPAIHEASFVLPPYVARKIGEKRR